MDIENEKLKRIVGLMEVVDSIRVLQCRIFNNGNITLFNLWYFCHIMVIDILIWNIWFYLKIEIFECKRCTESPFQYNLVALLVILSDVINLNAVEIHNLNRVPYVLFHSAKILTPQNIWKKGETMEWASINWSLKFKLPRND